MGEAKKVLGGMRIAKKVYLFDMRKRVTNSRQYLVQKEKVGLEKLKDIGSVFGSLKKGADSKAAAKSTVRRDEPAETKKSGGGMGVIKTIALAAFAFIALCLLVLFLIMPRASPVGEPAPLKVAPSVDFSVVDSGIITMGKESDDKNHAVYAVVSYGTKNVRNVTFNANTYGNKIPQQVFILDYPMDQAVSYNDFRKSLSENLKNSGIGVESIDIDGMETLPDAAVVVVPTGYVPSRFLEQSFNLTKLMERGVVIIYIGQEFDRGAMEPDGELLADVKATDYNRPGGFEKPITFSRDNVPQSDSGFGLVSVRYSVKGGNSADMLYGSVSSLRMNNSYFVFIPDALDAGWRNDGKAAGRDVARMISENAWEPTGTGSETSFVIDGQTNKENGTFTVFSNTYDGNNGYTLFYFEGASADGVKAGKRLEIPMTKEVAGDLYDVDGAFVMPSGISGKNVRLSADLREKKAGRTAVIIQTLKNTEVLRTDTPPGGTLDLGAATQIEYDADLVPGTYVLKLVDAKDNGKVYAQGGITVDDFQVLRVSWKDPVIIFQVRYKNVPQTVTRVNVSVDGKSPEEFKSVTNITYQPDVKLEANTYYTFTFDFGLMKKTLRDRRYVSQTGLENPLVWGLGLFALIMFAIGQYMKRPETEKFGLDIPDFPPTSTIKVPIKKEALLGIFEQVNKDYSWERMPLKLSEIKNGFRKLTFKGRPIMIADYNLERLLDVLIGKGLVKQELGYYGMARWETESKKSIAYLAVLRAMRDVFVANVVRFSKFGEKEDYATLINAGQEAYVQVYEDEKTAAKALKTCQKGLTIIVFKNADELDDFRELLDSTAPAASALKLEAQMGKLILASVDELDKVIKQMKG